MIFLHSGVSHTEELLVTIKQMPPGFQAELRTLSLRSREEERAWGSGPET